MEDGDIQLVTGVDVYHGSKIGSIFSFLGRAVRLAPFCWSPLNKTSVSNHYHPRQGEWDLADTNTPREVEEAHRGL